jgi:hypothetical protein
MPTVLYNLYMYLYLQGQGTSSSRATSTGGTHAGNVNPRAVVFYPQRRLPSFKPWRPTQPAQWRQRTAHTPPSPLSVPVPQMSAGVTWGLGLGWLGAAGGGKGAEGHQCHGGRACGQLLCLHTTRTHAARDGAVFCSPSRMTAAQQLQPKDLAVGVPMDAYTRMGRAPAHWACLEDRPFACA